MKPSYILLIIALAVAVACNKYEINDSCAENEDSYILSPQEAALQDFAVILSRAIYNEPELRVFIKNKAKERFDRDNDVFYPWVKNDKLSDGRSIREVLSGYDDLYKLDDIENTVPLLNILVPDWSWIHDECFSLDNWDTSIAEVGIGYRSNEIKHKVYCNGKLDGTLDLGEFPSAPLLLVKANERMKVVMPATKGADVIFEFRDDIFNKSLVRTEDNLATKGSDAYFIHDLNYVAASPNVAISILPYRLENVLSETSQNDTLAQRDYLYYDMTATRDTGAVNIRYHERILKFKLNPSVPQYYDDPYVANSTHRDYKLKEYYYVGANTALSNQQLSNMLWADGALEIRFNVYCGTLSWSSVYTVSFPEAFSIKKVKEHRRYNFLGAIKSRTYYLGMNSIHSDAGDWLSPKWINANISLFTWDLSSYPTRYEIKIIEEDAETTQQFNHLHSYEMATNFTMNGGVDTPTKIGYAYGISQKTANNTTFIETRNTKDYVLGITNVEYTDPIITGISTEGGSSAASLYMYSVNAVDFVALPTYYSN